MGQIRGEVRNQPQPEEAKWVASENKAYDEDKVDRLKERLATVVGEYGARIGQLESDDMISLVVFGRSGRSPDFAWTPGLDKTVTFTFQAQGAMEGGIIKKVPGREKENSEPKPQKEVVVTESPASTTLVTPPQVSTVPTHIDVHPVPFGSYGKPATTLILTFNRSLLEGKKGSDWERLLKDAQVVQY